MKDFYGTARVLLIGLLIVAVVGVVRLVDRLTDGLDAYARGMTMGVFLTFVGIGLIIAPMFVYLVVSRRADEREFLAATSKAKPPRFDVTVQPAVGASQEPGVRADGPFHVGAFPALLPDRGDQG